MLTPHLLREQIVIYYLLCIITIDRLAMAGTNLAHSASSFYPSPANQPPMPRLTPVAPNISPISTVATFSVPQQSTSTTSAPFQNHEHQALHQTTTASIAGTTTTPNQLATVTTLSPTPAPTLSPTTFSMMVTRQPSTVQPILPQERNVMSNIATTETSPDEFMVFRTTAAPDSTLFKSNKSFEDFSFINGGSDLPQQPPSQPQDNPMSASPDLQNFSHDVNQPGVPQDNRNDFAQPNSSFNDHQQSNQSTNSVSTAEQPPNMSHNALQNLATGSPPVEVAPILNFTVPPQNTSLDVPKDAGRQNETPEASQISPESRSDFAASQLIPQLSSPPPLPPVNLTSTSNERKHQILKPKSKFKCTQESDCNHGACLRGTCFCEQGFTGESCAINIDECLQFGSESCLNNGTCVDEINGYRCDCLPGFRGDHCQDLADMCNDFPCSNNATCINHRTNYTCNCEPGWEGRHCENNINDCLKNPCENDASCHDLVNGYRCDCPQGFAGTNCEINIDDCEKNVCQNNSTCRDLTNDYECLCRPGFSGKNCEENIDDCATMPCVHGECTDLIDSYKCKCQDGYAGSNCDQDIDECDRPVCQNGGSCINTEGSFKCSCREGYTGKECSVISDFCKARQPCKNGGNCKNINTQKGLYQCQCHSGYLGTHCERRRACDLHECNFDHAHCVSNVTCACLPGRREERTMCEYVTSCEQVEGELCLHGGKCKNLEQGGYHCTCQDPWYGPVCQFQAEAQLDAILLVVITCVGFLLAACAVVSLVIFRSVRKARATRGTYSPSTQEKFGNSASDLLKPPVPERLI